VGLEEMRRRPRKREDTISSGGFGFAFVSLHGSLSHRLFRSGLSHPLRDGLPYRGFRETLLHSFPDRFFNFLSRLLLRFIVRHFPSQFYRRRTVFLAALLADFFTAFLAGFFLAATLATLFSGVLFTAFFATALFATVFFAAFFGEAFFVAFFITVLAAFFTGAWGADFFATRFLAGAVFKTSVTEFTAVPTAVLTEPAKSSAIAIPNPTALPAFSNIVFSAISDPSIFRSIRSPELYTCGHQAPKAVKGEGAGRGNAVLPPGAEPGRVANGNVGSLAAPQLDLGCLGILDRGGGFWFRLFFRLLLGGELQLHLESDGVGIDLVRCRRFTKGVGSVVAPGRKDDTDLN
jgi:hypothetical protein